MPAVPTASITDVGGVLVGHHHRIGDGWATGVTVVLAPDGTVGGVDVRGGGPGTRETDLLDPSNLVQHVNAVLLCGGSAYGLAAADGVVRWLAERGRGFPVGARPHEVVPIVPAAVLFDLPMGSWGNTPDAGFGAAACEAASGAAPAQGSVGAGAGATAGRIKGGVGTAGVALGAGFTVGALVAANPFGEVVDISSGLPFAAGPDVAGEFGLCPPARDEVDAAAGRLVAASRAHQLNTTLGVVATDAALTKAECRRLAMAGHDGVARAVRPAHTLFDGDTVFALATGARPLPDGAGRAPLLNALAAAAADTVASAIVRAVVSAGAVGGAIGGAAGDVASGAVSGAVAGPAGAVPSYRELWPSALG